MADGTRISDLVDGFASGRIRRDDYWLGMQQFHLGLQEYRRLVRGDMLDHIEINAHGLRLVLKNGLRMLWNPEDLRTAPNILVNHGEYEPAERALLERLAAGCRVVFDVGANVGWYSLHFARLLREAGGKVYAFEPVPRTFATLKRNIELNDYGDTIRPWNHAFGEKDGTATFYILRFTGSVAASQRRLFPDDANEAVECAITTLDGFMAAQQIERLDLMKCDVEGAELFVLRGGLKTIDACRPVIMLELLRKWSRVYGYHPDDVIPLLRTYGYRCWSHEGKTVSEVAAIDEACAQTNFFFLHEPAHEALLAGLQASL